MTKLTFTYKSSIHQQPNSYNSILHTFQYST